MGKARQSMNNVKWFYDSAMISRQQQQSIKWNMYWRSVLQQLITVQTQLLQDQWWCSNTTMILRKLHICPKQANERSKLWCILTLNWRPSVNWKCFMTVMNPTFGSKILPNACNKKNKGKNWMIISTTSNAGSFKSYCNATKAIYVKTKQLSHKGLFFSFFFCDGTCYNHWERLLEVFKE